MNAAFENTSNFIVKTEFKIEFISNPKLDDIDFLAGPYAEASITMFIKRI